MELTSAELTILGLIVEQPRHGYDLEQVIEQRGIRQWTDIGFSSIYYVLVKLEKRALIDAEEIRGGAKSRRVFQATVAGKRIAAYEAMTFIAGLRMVAHPILVGLANLALVSELDYQQSLRSRLSQVEARIASIMNAKQMQTSLPRPAREVFSYALSLLEAERLWLAARVQVSDE